MSAVAASDSDENSDENSWFSRESHISGEAWVTLEESGMLLDRKNIKYYVPVSFFESLEKIVWSGIPAIAW